MKEYCVTSCNDCPFYNHDFYESSCNHPDTTVTEHEMTPHDKKYIPHGCPLIHNETKVSIKIGSVLGKHNYDKLQILKGKLN